MRGNYGDISKGIKTKTSNSAISEASYQVILATHSIATDDHEKNVNSFLKNGKPLYHTHVYTPIIVTTANLFIINYQLDDINPTTGEIPYDKAELIPINNVLYEYPVPPHLQIVNEDEQIQLSDYRKDIKVRSYIHIVNANYFQETLNFLINNCDDYIESE